MIFVTLGTQDKEFPRLLDIVNEAIENGIIKEPVVAQIGNTKYNKRTKMKLIKMMSVDEFNKYLKKADVIITHAGVGTIVNALDMGKKIIAVPRLKKYQEHVNDHQLQILKEFSKKGLIIPLKEKDKLEDAIEKTKDFIPNKYENNNEKFIKNLRKEIESI